MRYDFRQGILLARNLVPQYINRRLWRVLLYSSTSGIALSDSVVPLYTLTGLRGDGILPSLQR